MLNPEILKIIEDSKDDGWVVEPSVKRILKLSGIDVMPFEVGSDFDEARKQAQKLGYPLAAKVVSPKIMHKSEVGGVVLGIQTESRLSQVIHDFKKMDHFQGVHLEPMATGVELIVGAKNDYQFGPVVMLGMGGTGVEIYQDVALRMAPIGANDVISMLNCLKAHQLITGYRGTPPINTDKLIELMLAFSEMAMALQTHFESIDLNPVLCGPNGCMIADARMILKTDS